MDKDGRWWRETRNGIMEEVFRCPRNPAPLYEPAPTSLAKSALTRILALVALVAPFAIIAGVALFITAVARDRIPSWIPWVMGVICYLLPQSRSRKRARPLRLQRNWITSVCVASGNRARGAVRRLAARGNAAADLIGSMIDVAGGQLGAEADARSIPLSASAGPGGTGPYPCRNPPPCALPPGKGS